MRKNQFILARPGSLAQNARADEAVVHSDFSYPKADITRRPDHVGIIDLDWSTAGITVPFGEVRKLFSIPHGYNGSIPAVVAAYQLERSGVRSAGMMGTQMGALGQLIMDADEKNVNLKYLSYDAVIPGTGVPVFRAFIRYYVFAERGFIKERMA